ncbi:MAG: fimbrillin family protein [Prevotella sp.]
MKKTLLFVGAAIVVLFSACSSDQEDCKLTIDDINKTITNSDVEIRLSTGGTKTRSSIESDDSGLFEADNLGIFCLAKGNLSINPTEMPIVWNPINEAARYSVWMDNVKTKAVFNEDHTATNLEWLDGSARWYPTGNWHAYTFYGYHPYSDNVVYDGVQVKTSFTIDGTQDIIWGKTNSDDTNAFSAYYFRQLEHADEVPSISFTHKLMRLTFSCIAGEDANGSTESAKNMGIVSVSVKNVPVNGELIIADKGNALNEGTLTFDGKTVADLVLHDKDDAPLGEEYWVQDEETSIGQGILLPVPSLPDQHFFIQVVLKDKSGNIFAPEYPMELRNTEGFQAGKSYNVTMTINGPKLIEVNATLNKWELDDTNIEGIIL